MGIALAFASKGCIDSRGRETVIPTTAQLHRLKLQFKAASAD